VRAVRVELIKTWWRGGWDTLVSPSNTEVWRNGVRVCERVCVCVCEREKSEL